jgi:hypothetical protein
MPVFRRYLSLLACAKVHFFCTQGSRVRPASGIPCALSPSGAASIQNSGETRRENDFARHCEERSDEAIHLSAR